ncbi:hypothetical protein HRG_004416 [Hirsutella rhossiliensis]|uniref:Mitochondrial pyruvate carrier n=1 Tax=Hirsutella rhossiliensis TaxID=111463 RepID=A0A9P8MXP4_9HYPO|nr:uncharacterized protein HRG_04416 [Hirsutella rhossiliensis]KAH0963988.1 hypothetical protein HRG_04416 [Hirsutella rhossiliensis]
MVPSSTLMRASRPLFRQAFRRTQRMGQQQQQQQHQFQFRFRDGAGRRWQSTASDTAHPSWFKRMWESEVGIKTVHFWAPVMKWALVLAGISDFARPAEKLSFTQNFALTCTGLIWTRWCLIIKPKNYLLAAVNFFLGIVGIIQLTRIGMHGSSKNKSVSDVVDDVKEDVKDQVKA